MGWLAAGCGVVSAPVCRPGSESLERKDLVFAMCSIAFTLFQFGEPTSTPLTIMCCG